MSKELDSLLTVLNSTAPSIGDEGRITAARQLRNFDGEDAADALVAIIRLLPPEFDEELTDSAADWQTVKKAARWLSCPGPRDTALIRELRLSLAAFMLRDLPPSPIWLKEGLLPVVNHKFRTSGIDLGQ